MKRRNSQSGFLHPLKSTEFGVISCCPGNKFPGEFPVIAGKKEYFSVCKETERIAVRRGRKADGIFLTGISP